MKTLLAGGVILVGVVTILFGVGLLLPPEWRVERSITVNAPRERVYPLLVSLKNGWSRWNPFIKPEMTVTYSGPDEGVGATLNWTGGGAPPGNVRITRADPAQGIEYGLMAGSMPLEGKVSLGAEGPTATRVTWTDQGTIGVPILRFIRFGVNKFVGKPMERGLLALKQHAESSVPVASGH